MNLSSGGFDSLCRSVVRRVLFVGDFDTFFCWLSARRRSVYRNQTKNHLPHRQAGSITLDGYS